MISEEPGRTICCIGDSLTDGFVSKAGIPLWGRFRKMAAYWRYPDYLGRRLLKVLPTERISVCQAGISGNRLLGKGVLPMFGPALVDRFEKDALYHPNLSDVIVLIGINDLGFSSKVNIEEIKDSFLTLIARCKSHGVRIHLGTLPPAGGCGLGFLSKWFSWGLMHGSNLTNERRAQLNQWILSEAPVDSVIDFDLALRNPVNTAFLLPALDSGDHLHPSEQGYAVMANTIDLAKLGRSDLSITRA